MKILYHHRIGSKDGQAVHIDEIVKALTELGHHVAVVGPSATERASFGTNAGFIAVLKKHLPPAFYELLELAYGVPAFFRLWRAYRRERPDLLYERYNLYLLAGVWLHWLTQLPMLLEVNSPLVQERSHFDSLANKRLAAWAERLAWRSADYVLPVTKVLAGFVRDAGVDPQQIVVIPNGVGAEFLSGEADASGIRRRFGLEDRTVLGFTGFVRDWHRLDRVIDLIAESEPRLMLHLLLVGDGPAIPKLRQRAEAQGVASRVTFAGLVPRQEIADYIAAFDVALQPQVNTYASPLKLIEYMAMGRAIVAPATLNIREVITEEEAVLFDPEDPTAFRFAVERICRDPALRQHLGRAARSALDRQGLTWANNARRIVSLAESLRDPAPSPRQRDKKATVRRESDKACHNSPP